jgi:acetyl-CoA acetyltransferase
VLAGSSSRGWKFTQARIRRYHIALATGAYSRPVADVLVIGAAATRVRSSGHRTAELAYVTAMTAMYDADVQAHDIPAVFVGCGGTGADAAVEAISVRLGLRRLGIRGEVCGLGTEQPARIEHISPTAGEALRAGWQAVARGVYDIVLCIGAQCAPPVQGLGDGAWPSGAGLRSRADSALRYMTASGATLQQLARVSEKNLGHGAVTHAERISADQVLASKVLRWPLTRLMVASYGEGAAALILASARAKPRSARKAPRVRTSLVLTGDAQQEPIARAGQLAYTAAAVGPEDLDCAELDDATAASELAAYEQLQLAPPGQGPELIDSGYTALGGVLPVNTSGGMLSLGESPGMSGLSQVCQLAWQLRGQAGSAQVPAARAGIAQSGGGYDDRADPVTLTILTT